MTNSDILKARLESHVIQNDKDMANIIGSMKNIARDVEKIKDNHLSHIQKDMSEMIISITKNTDGIKRLDDRADRSEKLQWYMLVTGITTLLGIVVNTYLTVT